MWDISKRFEKYYFYKKYVTCWDFLGGQWLRIHLSAQEMQFDPGQENKIPHAVVQLSLWGTPTEPACSRAQCHNQGEAHLLQ